MPLPTGTNLLDEIRNGTYSPSTLEGCDDRLPRDRNPHRVRMTQFFFFTSSDKTGAPNHRLPEYLILQKHLLASGPADTKLNDAITQIASKAAGYQHTRADIKSGKLVDPADPKGSLEAIRAILNDRKVPVGRDLPEPAVRERYTRYIQASLLKESSWLNRVFDRYGKFPLSATATAAEIADAIRDTLFPPPFASLDSPQPHFALCAIYEQTWTPLGYTRGDLVSSISLAPGEQVTLEFHSWDKTTSKSEDELSTESEMRLSSKLNQRDTQEVVSELSSESGSKMNGSFSLAIPLGSSGAKFGAAGGAETTNQIHDSTKNTVSSTSERTEEAALTLKNLRKTRIEVARDTGKENKQTRVIVNTNRGHALNCNYFEIMSNYFVETRFVEFQPCLFLPYRRQPVERKWVLSHEFILRQALLDPSFLPGFQAAKLLEVSDALEALQTPACEPQDGSGTPASEAECTRLRSAILSAFTALTEDTDEAIEAMTGPALLSLGLGFVGYIAVVLVRLGGHTLPLQRAIYLALLHTRPGILNALRTLDGSVGQAGLGAREALRAFFASLTPADFQIGVVSREVEKGLDDLGLPGIVIDIILVGGLLLSYATDDAGLQAAVNTAHQRLVQLGEAVPAAPAATAATNPVPGYPASRLKQKREEIPIMQRAEALVEFERLRSHLEEYGQHYQQAVWLRTHPDERARYLQAQGIPVPLLGDEILGFQDDKAGYAISNTPAVKQFIDFDALMNQAKAQMKDDKPSEVLISLPTPSTMLETKLGECDACEEYIIRSREIELRAKEAEARQQEAEADRRVKRISATPPDLGEFVTVPNHTVPEGGN